MQKGEENRSGCGLDRTIEEVDLEFGEGGGIQKQTAQLSNLVTKSADLSRNGIRAEAKRKNRQKSSELAGCKHKRGGKDEESPSKLEAVYTNVGSGFWLQSMHGRRQRLRGP